MESMDIEDKIKKTISINSLTIRPVISLDKNLYQKTSYITLEIIPEEKKLLCYKYLLDTL